MDRDSGSERERGSACSASKEGKEITRTRKRLPKQSLCEGAYVYGKNAAH